MTVAWCGALTGWRAPCHVVALPCQVGRIPIYPQRRFRISCLVHSFTAHLQPYLQPDTRLAVSPSHILSMPHSITTSNGSTPPRRGVYLLTHPRSASNLFQTMMSKQRSYGADVQSSGYHFFDASFPTICQLDRGNFASWPEEEREGLYAPYKAAFEKLNGELSNAEKEVRQDFLVVD